jgi:hypothetical protein
VNKKKVKLIYKQEYNFLLLGISSYEKDYRLIWNLNNNLNLFLAKTEDHYAYHKKAEGDQFFSCFLYMDKKTMLEYKIISNKSENGILIDELKTIDYFFILKGDYLEDYSDLLRHKISLIENIQAVFLIDAENLKNKERLIVDS